MEVREEGEKEKEGDRNGVGEKEKGRKRGVEGGRQYYILFMEQIFLQRGEGEGEKKEEEVVKRNG